MRLHFGPLLFTFGRFALSARLFALSSALLLDSHRSRIKNMSVENVPSRVLYQDLDTSFVNLWGLLGYLSRQSFVGRVHVELSDYSADVFLDGADTPLVHEIDNVAGTDVVEEAALHRLVLRVREAAGEKNGKKEGGEGGRAPHHPLFFCLVIGRPPSSTLFPNTPLFQSMSLKRPPALLLWKKGVCMGGCFAHAQ